MAEQRMIRASILTSDAVNVLSWPAEVFYRRLMSVVDDFGRYDARADILRSSMYPLKLDTVSKSDIGKWLAECAKAGLVRLYSMDGRDYLELQKFGQQIKIKKSKYPIPQNSAAIRSGSLRMAADSVRPLSEVEVEEQVEDDVDVEDVRQPPAIMNGLVNIDHLKEKVFIDRGYFTDLHCMKYRIEKETLYQWLLNFNAHNRFLGVEVKTEKDYRSHFANWFAKQGDKLNPAKWKTDTSKPLENQPKAGKSVAEIFLNAK